MWKEQPKFQPDETLVYLRKSRSDDPDLEVEEVLQKHETILDEWAEKHLGGTVPEENKFREVVSGETMKERPEIQRLLRLIESPKYRAVAVVEPQRLTRGDLEEIGRLMKLLKHTDTYVLTPQRGYSLRDEYDWDAFERELKRGNDYLEYTKKILNRGRLLSVSQGNFIGNTPPYGYDKDTVVEGKRKCPTLKINQEQADVVRMIFDLYVNEDMGPNNICNRLDSLGIKPPRGKYWSPEGVRDMLSNIHYIGKVRWNWRKTVTKVEEGEYVKTRPKNKIGEYLIYDGKHPAIISEELFNAAQTKKGKTSRSRSSSTIRNPLASLLFCSCGRAMTYRTYTSHNSAPRLLCDGQVHCKSGSCTYDEMIGRVCEILEQCIEDFELKIKDDTQDAAKRHARLIKNLEKKLETLKARELALWKAQADPDPGVRMPPEIFKELKDELLREKDELTQALKNAYESMPEPVNYEERAARFRDALDALKDPKVSATKKNKLLKQCIDRITYTRERPERLPSQKKKITVDGKRKSTSPLIVGGNWSSPPIHLDVKLKI